MIDWLRRRLGPAAPVEADGCAVDAGSVATMQAAALAFAEGESQFKKGSFEEAVVSLERAISCQHDLPEAHFLLGLVHEKCGRLEDAGDCLLLATTFRPDFADAWFQLGVVDMARGRASKASSKEAGCAQRSASFARCGDCESAPALRWCLLCSFLPFAWLARRKRADKPTHNSDREMPHDGRVEEDLALGLS